MNNTTLVTRQLSFEDIKPKRKIRYEQILDRLMTGIKTAKEVAEKQRRFTVKIEEKR